MRQGRKRRVPSREGLADCVKGRAALLTSEHSLQNSWNPNFLMYCCRRIEPNLVGIGSLLAHCGFRVSNFTWSLEYQSPQSISSQKVLISCPSGWHSREFRSSHSQKPAKGVAGASHRGTVRMKYYSCLCHGGDQEWLGWRVWVLSQLWLVSYTCSDATFL